MFDPVSKLRRDIDETRTAIEGMLDEYGLFIDNDMAGVISSYVRALHLDFELAMGRGSREQMGEIVEDMMVLHSDTRERLQEVRMSTGASVTPLQG